MIHLHANGTATVRQAQPCEYRDYLVDPDGGRYYTRDLRCGDLGCLVTACGNGHDVAWLQPAPVGGNSDHAAKRLHGWRGTTNDVCVTAHGWRRVLSVKTYKNGATMVRFSADMRPDEA